MITQITLQSKLDRSQRERMFHIMNQYYEGVTETQFERDLNEKKDVILLMDEHHQIQGFSTILVTELNHRRKKIIAIYSGDTVLTKEYWGRGDLAYAFGQYLIKTRLKNPMTEIYWFLISKGYKTYLLMTNNFSEHWPRYDRKTPAKIQELLKQFYSLRFGEFYNEQAGLILPDPNKVQALKNAIADIDESLLQNKKIKFFVTQNPSWQKGVELCCVARVTMKVPAQYLIKFLKKKILHLFKNQKK